MRRQKIWLVPLRSEFDRLDSAVQPELDEGSSTSLRASGTGHLHCVKVLVGAAVALSALAGSACGLKRVPGNILEQLPYEARIELLEAENDLALAVDRLDEAKNEVGRTRDQIRRAKDRRRAAADEVGVASDQVSRDVAELAVIEAEARVEWLRARQGLNVREEELAEHGLVCAQARYEVARLTAARKAKLEGSEAIDPQTFEDQVKDCDAQHAALEERLKESTTEANQVRAEWDRARTALSKKTFDARASPYVE